MIAPAYQYGTVYCRIRMTRYDQLLRHAEDLWKREKEERA